MAASRSSSGVPTPWPSSRSSSPTVAASSGPIVVLSIRWLLPSETPPPLSNICSTIEGLVVKSARVPWASGHAPPAAPQDEAGGLGVRLARPHSTAPPSASTRMACLETTRGPPSPPPGGPAAPPAGRRPGPAGSGVHAWASRDLATTGVGPESRTPAARRTSGALRSRPPGVPLESPGVLVPHTALEPPAMRVTVIGAGHVGLVTAACLAHVGHDVVVDDDDPGKLELIREGRSWFFEPGLEELLGEVVGAGRLRLAAGKAEAVHHGVVVFVCVGTPSRGDGSPNLAYVEAVAREVARSLPAGEFRVVCEKSTVPVQTGERVAQVIAREASPGAEWEVASNPEFLREGSAVADTLRPDRVVVGTTSERGLAVLRELYDPILEG